MGKRGISVGIYAAVVAAFLGCGGSSTSVNVNARRGAANTDQGQAIVVTVGKSETRDVASIIQATGSLVASEISDIAPKAAGKIANISVNVGQFVGGGAVIAKIDDRDARIQLATAQAGVKQAQAGVRQAEARLGLLEGGRFNASTVPEVSAA